MRKTLAAVAAVATILGWFELSAFPLILKLSVLALTALVVVMIARLERRHPTRGRLGGLEAHVDRLEDLKTPCYDFAKQVLASARGGT